MNRLYQYLIIFVSFVVLIIGCSDHAMINNVTERDGGPALSSVQVGEEIVYTLTAVDWVGVSPFEPNIFYRIKDVNLLKDYFSADETLINWLNTLPISSENEVSFNTDEKLEDQILIVSVIANSSQETNGPVLAAVGWSANATVTPLSGGSIARCQTTTTNPSGVSGYKSHQIWVFNQDGHVYFADIWATLDLLEHIVNFSHDQSVPCNSTVWCMGRVVLNGDIKALDTDNYTRICNQDWKIFKDQGISREHN